MELLDESLAPLFVYRCDCGHTFECDAGTEENCFWAIWPDGHGANCAQCPQCGRIDSAKQPKIDERVVIRARKHIVGSREVLGVIDSVDRFAEGTPAVWVRVNPVERVKCGLDDIRRLDLIETLATIETLGEP